VQAYLEKMPVIHCFLATSYQFNGARARFLDAAGSAG